MKRVMCFMLVLVWCLPGIAFAEVITETVIIDLVRDLSEPNNQEFARIRYTGATVDYDFPGSWMMIGDHIHGANHYSDGITKFHIGPQGFSDADTINSVTLQGYFHKNGTWDAANGDNNVYMALSKYDNENGALPITLADWPDWVDPCDPCNVGEPVTFVTTLSFATETQHYFTDPSIKAAVLADIAAGYDYTGYVWQASDPCGNVLVNGASNDPCRPESDIYMTGFPGWEWGANLDSPDLKIEYTYEYGTYVPPTTTLPNIEVTVAPDPCYVGSYLEYPSVGTWSSIEFPTPYMRLGDRYGGFVDDAGIVKFKLPPEIKSTDFILSASIEAAGSAYDSIIGGGPGDGSFAGTVYAKIARYAADNTWPLNDPGDHPNKVGVRTVAIEQHVEDGAFSWNVAEGVAADVAAGKEYSSYFITLVKDPNGKPLDGDREYYLMEVYSQPQLRIVYATPPTNCAEVIASGLALDGDLSPYQDCLVNIDDIQAMSDEWGTCTTPEGTGCVQGDIAEPTGTIARGSATVNAVLDEWTGAEWVPIDKNIYLNPDDVTEAKMALRWDETEDKVYAAVVVTDTTHFFSDDYDGIWDASDRIEIFSQGDINAGDPNFNDENVQQYFFGSKIAADGTSWRSWANGFAILDDPCLEAAVAIDGDTITYELGIKMYDEYCGRIGGCSSTVVSALAVGEQVRLDVVVDTRWGNLEAEFGVLAVTSLENRSGDASSITVYDLVEDIPCGGWGYVDADLFRDCVVDVKDLDVFAQNWLICNDPEDVDCIENW
jgi:hypothetical protein